MLIKAANRQDTRSQASRAEASETGKDPIPLTGLAFIGFAAWLNSFFGSSVDAKEANTPPRLTEETVPLATNTDRGVGNISDSSQWENPPKRRQDADSTTDLAAAEDVPMNVDDLGGALASEIAGLNASLNLLDDESQLDESALSSFELNQVGSLATGDLSVTDIEQAGMFSPGDFVNSSITDDGLEVSRMGSDGGETPAFVRDEDGREPEQDFDRSQVPALDTQSDQKCAVDLWSAFDFSNF